MTRFVTLLVGINAMAGIAAFVIAQGLWRRGRRKAQDMLRIEAPPEDSETSERRFHG